MKKMHWLYLLCGGFIIGTICSILSPLWWNLAKWIFKNMGFYWTPTDFMKRCWGYW
jgi:hypothetical protein